MGTNGDSLLDRSRLNLIQGGTDIEVQRRILRTVTDIGAIVIRALNVIIFDTDPATRGSLLIYQF
jgi:hypothetical protein